MGHGDGSERPLLVDRPKELKTRSDDLALLLRITNSLNSGRELGDILDTLYEGFREVMPYDRMEYAVLEAEGYVLTTTWVRANYGSVSVPVGYAYRRSEPIDQTRFLNPFFDNELGPYAAGRAHDHPVVLLVGEGIHSALYCPLVVGDEVTGVLFLNSLHPDAYNTHHLDLIQLIAGHLASILEHSRLNEQLKAQNETLRALEQSRLEFIASISHELRTPLTAVVGFASELRDRLAEFSDDDVAQFASMIASESTEVSGLVEDLLVITRAEAGRLEVRPELVRVSDQVKWVYESMAVERNDQEVVLVLADVEALGDPLRVRQIARNLVSNAARYGGPNVAISVAMDSEHAVLTVADNGPGIPESDRDSIFEAYGRSHRFQGRPGSIGLGLTVSRYLAEAMGGSLTYDRVEEESRFILRLPLYQHHLESPTEPQ
jgi:hypothetical protein